MRKTRTIKVNQTKIPVYENEQGVEFCPVLDHATGETFFVPPREVKYARVESNQFPLAPEIKTALKEHYYGGERPYVACSREERFERLRNIFGVVGALLPGGA